MKTLFNYPEYAEIDGEKYKINTDFRIAIQCNQLSMDMDMDDVERGLAIIYLLFGKKGLYDTKNHIKLSEKAVYFLKCGNIDTEDAKAEDVDFDFEQDFPYIEASFKSDYGMDLENVEMHWWKFYYLFCGLSQSELGNSCIFNKIRDLRNTDTSKIEDAKTRKKVEEAKKHFALKKKNVKEEKLTEQEILNIEEFYKKTGLNRKE